MSKSVRICHRCSNVNIDKLKKIVGSDNIKIGCISACRKEKTQFFGRVNGIYTIRKTEEEFLEECK